MLFTWTPKLRECPTCRNSFMPARPMQRVCGPRCAMAKVRADRKQERVTYKARRKALETIPELIKAAQVEFNKFVRARDAKQPCICCGRQAHDGDLLTGSRWDAGHYRSTGSAPHLRFNEDNCHRQLVFCNRHGAGRAVDYRLGLIGRIGLARVEALEADNAVHHWTREELRAIRETYRLKRKQLMEVAG